MSQINNLFLPYTHVWWGVFWQIFWGVFYRLAAKHGEPTGDKKPPKNFATKPPSYMCVQYSIRSLGDILPNFNHDQFSSDFVVLINRLEPILRLHLAFSCSCQLFCEANKTVQRHFKTIQNSLFSSLMIRLSEKSFVLFIQYPPETTQTTAASRFILVASLSEDWHQIFACNTCICEGL